MEVIISSTISEQYSMTDQKKILPSIRAISEARKLSDTARSMNSIYGSHSNPCSYDAESMYATVPPTHEQGSEL